MAVERSDRRVRYTKTVLKQSLLELMKDRPIGKITVTEICRLADVNRNTFYAHYKRHRGGALQLHHGRHCAGRAAHGILAVRGLYGDL